MKFPLALPLDTMVDRACIVTPGNVLCLTDARTIHRGPFLLIPLTTPQEITAATHWAARQPVAVPA